MKENICKKGITLISLVITIVVMLIVAGIAISISVNEEGLFTKSQEASKLQTRSQEFEALKSIELNLTLENMGTVLISDLKQAFEDCDFVENVTYKDENTLGVRTINNNVFEFSGGVLKYVGEGTTHIGGVATCTEAPICTMCGQSYGTALGHEIPEVYETDETHHWKLCSRGCGEYIVEKTAHSSNAITCTEDAICYICNEKTGTALGHGIPEVYETDETHHWKLCSRGCGEYIVEKTAHSSNAITCTEDAICSICNEKTGTALGHIEPDAYETDGTNHWKLCDRGCGEYVIAKTAHNGGTATCKVVATCVECNIGYGSTNSSNHSGTKSTSGCTYYKWSCCGKSGGYSSHSYPCSGSNHKRGGGSVTIKCSRCSATKKYTVTNGTCTYWKCSCGSSGGVNSHSYSYSCSKSGHTIYGCLCSRCSYCGSCGKKH